MMSTEIILNKRRTGKTTQVIIESHLTDKYILVPNRQMAQHVFNQARDMYMTIPFPVTVEEWRSGAGLNIKRQGVIIDEGLMVLEKLLGTHIHMVTISERYEGADE